jgi:hypothetical protein
LTIAYLVIVHDHPRGLARLVNALRDPAATFIVHVDAKADITPFKKAVPPSSDVTYVDRRISVNWGGWSQVQATLNTIETAVRLGVHARYVLLSGACLPLTTPSDIALFFKGNEFEYINTRAFPDAARHKPWSRLSKWHFEGGDRTPGLMARAKQVANRLAKVFPDRPVESLLNGYLPYTGSNWWALTADAIAAIRRAVIERPELITLYRMSKCPDEAFFQTVVANELGTSSLKRSLTYADWSNPSERPAFIRASHLQELREAKLMITDDYGHGPVLFARKFNARNEGVANQLADNLNVCNDVRLPNVGNNS